MALQSHSHHTLVFSGKLFNFASIFVLLNVLFQQSTCNPVVLNYRPVDPTGISDGSFAVPCK